MWRPANGVEVAAAWAAALERKDGPSEIILSRQKVDEPPHKVEPQDARRGAYVALDCQGAPDVVVIGTGSEVGPAVVAAKALQGEGMKIRVVSMPCCEVFERQDAQYREAVLPRRARRASVEAGRTDYWYRWIGLDGLAIGVDKFGASAPAGVLAEKYGLTGKQIADDLRAWAKK